MSQKSKTVNTSTTKKDPIWPHRPGDQRPKWMTHCSEASFLVRRSKLWNDHRELLKQYCIDLKCIQLIPTINFKEEQVRAYPFLETYFTTEEK